MSTLHSTDLAPSDRRQAGFGLMELTVCLAIAGLLMTLSFSSYSATLRKQRRADGQNALLALHAAQMHWRSDHPQYSQSLSELGIQILSANGHYRIQVDSANATGFMASAHAVGGQQKDQTCRVLHLSWTAPHVLALAGPDPQNDGSRCWNS
jgi:prepilin-type N-terminal cleavage/methylation domain-containing protein